MGGVGKSVVAAALARTAEARRVFTDGIVWQRIGKQPDLLTAVRVLVALFMKTFPGIPMGRWRSHSYRKCCSR